MKSSEILLKLVQGNEGKKWASKATRIGWKSTDVSEESGTPACQWSGVICNDSNDETIITEIDLSDTIMIGTIPSELGQLINLRKLDLSLNLIRGSIPHCIEQLPNLEVLDLSENQLTGVFPKLESKVLRSLNLSYNRLVGTLHGDLGVAYPEMTDLDLMENQLTGHIPDSLGGMSSLAGLSLASNAFCGTIPQNIGHIDGLRYLYLDNNNLVGLIPPSIAREDSILEELWLQNNLLSGTIPAQLSILTKLVSFFIDGNKFTGTVPTDLCREGLNANFYQDVAQNIERNYCDSIACPSGKYSIKGIFPCFSCTDNNNDTSLANNESEPPPSSNTYNPYLGKAGSKCFDINQRDILTKFFAGTGGHSFWKHEENWDVEDSFLCTFSGITCNANNHVIAIELSNMGLTGLIPQELGFLRYLQRLDLSGNQLTGFLPSDLRFAPLVFLDVSGNKLRGVVPPMLCLKAGINGNGNDGDYNCDYIACSLGTVNSETGRRSVDSTSGKCSPCPINNVDFSNLFIGSKICPAPSSRNSITSSSKDGNISENHAITGFLFFAFFISAIAFFLYFIKQRNLNNNDTGSKRSNKRNSFGLLDEQNRFVNLQARRTSVPLINNQQNNRSQNIVEEDVTIQSHASHEEVVTDGSFHNDQSISSNASNATKKKRAKKKYMKRGSNDSNKSVEERHQPEQQQLSPQRPDTSASLSVSNRSRHSQDGSTMTGQGSSGSGSTEQVDVWLDVPKLT